VTEVSGAKVFSGVVNARQRETTRFLSGSGPTGLWAHVFSGLLSGYTRLRDS